MSRFIPEQETLTVEFKSDLKKVDDSVIFDAVVAFANTDGGDLYLGVENNGEITGVHKDHSNPITLGALIANNTIPPVSTRCEIIEDIRPVLKISVPKSYGGIVATQSGKVLRRRMKIDNTPESTPMYPSEMVTRLSDLRQVDYSSMVVLEGSEEDIDLLEIERLRKIILAYDGDKTLLPLNNIELLRALGFIREQNDMIYPTVAGLLMVGKIQSLRRFVPTNQASFQVLEGTTVRVNEDSCLPILAAIEKLITQTDVWNSDQEIELGMFRMPAPEFDKRSIREAIVNAFSHRDYSLLGRVRVAIADDGLTVANPGGFIEGVTIQNLLNAEPHGRNPILADALKRVGLAEKTGRGIDRIFEGSLIYGRPLPDYSNSTSRYVSLFIPRSKPDVQMTKLIADEQSKIGRPLPLHSLLILNLLKDQPRSDVKQLSEASHLSEAVVKATLNQAIESGLVEAFGVARGRNYMLSHRLYHEREQTIGYVLQRDMDEVRFPELIMNMAKANPFISRADVVNLLHVNEAKAYTLLRKLVDHDMLERINTGRYAKYRIKKGNDTSF